MPKSYSELWLQLAVKAVLQSRSKSESRLIWNFDNTMLFPKEGQMRFAGQASRSNKFAILLAIDHRTKCFFDLEGYLRKLALRITWPSFGNTTVILDYPDVAVLDGNNIVHARLVFASRLVHIAVSTPLLLVRFSAVLFINYYLFLCPPITCFLAVRDHLSHRAD
jgi:hypothetical protein